MAIYDEPGKGRKQCPGCEWYVAARTLVCPECSYKWGEAKTPVRQAPQVYDEPGKGRKQCAGCRKYLGARLDTCPGCGGTSFVKQEKVIPVYDEPGRGRKECTGCHKHIGYSIDTCPNCQGTKFVKKTPKVLTYDGPGPRRKQCPKCNTYVGRKAPICACGFDFPSVPESEAQRQRGDRWSEPIAVDVEASNARRLCGCGLRIVIAPAGEPPVRLKSADGPTIEEWVAETVAAGHEVGYHLSPAALRYYVRRYFFEEGSPELERCVSTIASLSLAVEADDEEAEEVAA